ncbi:hypothetical protein ACWEA7_45270, partial [Streptomyces sp. NPDC005093]
GINTFLLLPLTFLSSSFMAPSQMPSWMRQIAEALEADIRTWIQTWNEDPKPFTWTKDADEILNSLAKYIARISGASH